MSAPAKPEHWCSQCGLTLQHASVSHCDQHGTVCCVCDCRVAWRDAEDVRLLMVVQRGNYACQDCADELRAEAHENDDDGEPPCSCDSCKNVRSK